LEISVEFLDLPCNIAFEIIWLADLEIYVLIKFFISRVLMVLTLIPVRFTGVTEDIIVLRVFFVTVHTHL
jgi:hypothetical protein